tara:strand:- start:2166 stop:2396 length:231 start_codon:yes stop_codon:yes gene_type:complete
MTSETVWVKTPEAVRHLGRSKDALMRLVRIGHLEPGVHFSRGAYRNSAITWNLAACEATLGKLAMQPVPAHGEAVK